MVAVGETHEFDYQADIYRNKFRLVEDLGDGTFLAEHLEPDDEVLERYVHMEFSDYINPDEDLDAQMDRVGETFKIKFVSYERYHAAF